MLSLSPLQRLSFLTCLSSLALAPHLVQAQPEAGPRGVVPIPEKPPLTNEEIEKLVGKPTLLTYSGQNVPLADVVKLFQNAAGQPANLQGNGRNTRLPAGAPATISVNWKDKPFWEAAKEVETLTKLHWSQTQWNGLTLSDDANSENIDLSGELIADTPYVKIYGGTVWHTAFSNSSLSKTEAPKPPADNTRMTLMAYLDPKLRAVFNSLRPIEIKVMGANGQPLTGGPGWGQDFVGGAVYRSNQPTSLLIGQLNLNLPAGIPAKSVLASVGAKARVQVSANAKQWKVDDLLGAADAQEVFEGNQFTINSAVVQGKQLKLSVEFEGDPSIARGNNSPFLREAFNMAPAMEINPAFNGAVIRQQIEPMIIQEAGRNIRIEVNPQVRPNAGGGVVIGRPGDFGGPPAGAAPAPGRAPAVIVPPGGGFPMANPIFEGGRIRPNIGNGGLFGGIIIRDAQGRELRANNVRTNGATAVGDRQKIKADMTFDLTNADATGAFSFEWTLPATPRMVETPFEIKDLKVP